MHSHMQTQLSHTLAKAEETKPGSFWYKTPQFLPSLLPIQT